MIYDSEANAWQKFWQKAGDFFIKPDSSGVNYLTRILFSILIIVIAWGVIKLINHIYKKSLKIEKKLDIDVSAKFFIFNVIKVFYWILVAFLVISALKIEVTGIAGIASAVTVALGLALQDVIACFASGVIILHSKNMKTGDYISVQNSYGSCEGSITKIHFFFTHLKTPNGQEIIVPNNNMLHAVVTNYTKLGMRRVNYDVGVAYDTDIALAKDLLMGIVKDDPLILKTQELSVYVYELGAYSVGIRIRCWTKSSDYWTFYNALSEKVLLTFREHKVRIPSSTDIEITKQN